MVTPVFVAAFSSLLAVVSFAAYLSTIPRRRVAERPVNAISALLLSLSLSTGAAVWAFSGQLAMGTTLGAGALGVVLPLLFFYLLANRKTPLGKLQVVVGDTLLPFAAKTDTGESFHSDSLAGKRVLIKFFRGQWCPYCSAELRHFEELRPKLEERGVTILALSKDSVADAAKNRSRDGLGFTLLSDPDLVVIRQYGVEHHKALEFSKGGFSIAGLPLALVPQVKTMAIPTTLLVDEDGVIRWIDQAEDYRIRSGEARIVGALEEAFAQP